MLDAHRPALLVFFCKDTATTVIYTLSLHDALPIYEQFTVNLPDNVKVIDLDDVISGEKVSLSEATEALEQPFLYVPETDDLTIETLKQTDLEGIVNRTEIDNDYEKDGLPYITLSIFERPEDVEETKDNELS